MCFSFRSIQRFAALTLLVGLSFLYAPIANAQSAGEIEGEISVVIFDDVVSGRSETHYYILDKHDRKETRLYFQGQVPDEIRTGRKLKIRGRGHKDGLEVDYIAPADGDSGPDGPSAAAVAPPETRNVLTLLVDFNDATVDGPGMTYGTSLQEAKDRMYNEAKSVAGLFYNASLGTLTLDPDADNDGTEDVFGPYQINDSYIGGDSSQCSPSTWVSLASQAWQNANPGKDINIYRHRLLIVPNYWDWSNRHCGWGGVAQVGCGTWCWAIGADPDTIFHGVIIHELGHNLGFNHARTDTNNDGATDSEYGDSSDMMGGSRNWMKFNPPHAEDKGWIDPADYEIRTVVATGAPQNFDLISMDEEVWDWPGLRALKIERTGNSDYYVSYRLPEGEYNNVSSGYRNRVNIHYGYDNSTYSYFVTTLLPGESFTDNAANLQITALPEVTINGPAGSTSVIGVSVCQPGCSSYPGPSNLLANALSSSMIDLDWTDNSPSEDGFTLQRSTDGNNWSTLATLGANAVSYTDSGLATATTYHYRVRAFEGSEQSAWSNVATEQTHAIPPVASFTYVADYTQVSFTDTSSDPDGSITNRAWTFGDGNSSSATNPVHTYASAGNYTVGLTVTDNHGAQNSTSQGITVTTPPFADYFASGEGPTQGSLNGSYTATFSDDGNVQSITERESGGKPSNRHSYLEHQWTFNLTSAGTATLSVNAWQSPSSDGDTFDFAWSSNGSTWNHMFNISVTSDPGTPVSFELPEGTSGTVYVRVTDTDQTSGHRNQDTVFVDFMKIRVLNGPVDPLDGAPSNLAAVANGYDRIDLTWDDGSSNETGFRVQRRTGGGAWAEVATTGANAGATAAYSDTGLAGSTTYEYRVQGYKGSDSSAWTNIASATTGPAPAISLTANGYKVKGQHTVDLQWSGATGAKVDVRRDGVVVAQPDNTAPFQYTDNIGAKGAGNYLYEVCLTGSTTACSNVESVVF